MNVHNAFYDHRFAFLTHLTLTNLKFRSGDDTIRSLPELVSVSFRSCLGVSHLLSIKDLLVEAPGGGLLVKFNPRITSFSFVQCTDLCIDHVLRQVILRNYCLDGPTLSPGSCTHLQNMVHNDGHLPDFPLVVQVLALWKVSVRPSAPGSRAETADQYTATVSDGNSCFQAEFNQPLNELIGEEEHTVKKNTIIMVDDARVRTVDGKRTLVIWNMSVIAQVNFAIGNPLYIDSSEEIGTYVEDIDIGEGSSGSAMLDTPDISSTGISKPTESQCADDNAVDIPALSERACDRLYTAVSQDDPIYSSHLTVQLLSLRTINNEDDSNARWKVIFSDGTHYQQAILAKEAVAALFAGTVNQQNLVVEITGSTYIVIRNWIRVILIMSLEVVQEFGERIGNPQFWPTENDPLANNSEYTAAYYASLKPTLPVPITSIHIEGCAVSFGEASRLGDFVLNVEWLHHSTDAEAAFFELQDLPEVVEASPPRTVRAGHYWLAQGFLQRCRKEKGMIIPPVDDCQWHVEVLGCGHVLMELNIPRDDHDPPITMLEVKIAMEDPAEGRKIHCAIAWEIDDEKGDGWAEEGPKGVCSSCHTRVIPPPDVEGEDGGPTEIVQAYIEEIQD
ncbi:hypothetical protein NMY22_g14516 [Coprinellus aureogranulatus]|nr:hypothetical protein NMY22_g14516 [Coprinellus aureogranulatus]